MSLGLSFMPHEIFSEIDVVSSLLRPQFLLNQQEKNSSFPSTESMPSSLGQYRVKPIELLAFNMY